jgi:hypothetical protein
VNLAAAGLAVLSGARPGLRLLATSRVALPALGEALGPLEAFDWYAPPPARSGSKRPS